MEIFSDRRKIHNKIVALLLALLIAVTPLLSNIGGESGVKADENSPYDYTIKSSELDLTTYTDVSSLSNVTDVSKTTLYGFSGETVNFSFSSECFSENASNLEFECVSSTTDNPEYGSASSNYTKIGYNDTSSICSVTFSKAPQYLLVYAVYTSGNDMAYSTVVPDSYSTGVLVGRIELVSADKVVENAVNTALEKYNADTDTYYKDEQTITLSSNIAATYSVIDGNNKISKYTVYFEDKVGTSEVTGSPKAGTSYTVAVPTSTTVAETHTVSVYLGIQSPSSAMDAENSQKSIFSDSKKIASATINMTNDEYGPTVNQVYVYVGSDLKEEIGTATTNPCVLTVEGVDMSNIAYHIYVSDMASSTSTNEDGVGIKSVTYKDSTVDKKTDNNGLDYYSIPVSDWTEGGQLVVKDKAGNSNTYTLCEVRVFDLKTADSVDYTLCKSDGTAISFDTTGNNYYSGEDEVTLKITIKTTKSSVYAGYSCDKNSSEVGYSSTMQSLAATSEMIKKDENTNEYYYEYVFSWTLRAEKETVNYQNLKYFASSNGTNNDIADGENIYGGSISFDSEAPNEPTVVLQYSSKGSASDDVDWETYTSSYIDTSEPAENFRYKITNVSDNENGSGIADTPTISTTDAPSEFDGTATIFTDKTADSEAYYYYTFTDADIDEIKNSATTEYTRYAKVKDNAGNVCVYKLPKLEKLNTDISFLTIELKDSSNNIKTFDSITPSVNETYKLYVTVTSGWSLEKTVNGSDYIILRKESDLGNATEFALNSATGLNETYDLGRYTSTLVFDLPATDIAVTDNAQYDNITLYVKDIKGYSGSETLGQLIYDNSKPYVSKLDYKSGWVKAEDATLSYEIVSGSSSVVESNLTSASYTLEGEYNALKVSGSSVSGSVKMPESTSTAGTSIEFTAVDDAGNVLTDLQPNKATMYVDGHSPSVTALTAAGKSKFTAALSGAPVISTGASDNLSLSKIEAVVNYPNGTAKTYTKSYDANNGLGVDITDNYSFQLENTDGKAADGAYTVTVTAYDKAGNESVSRILKFTVDNTVPVLSAAISGGTKGGKQTRSDGTDYYYSSNVPVTLTVVEENFVSGNVTVTDKIGNDSASKVNVTWTKSGDAYVATYTAVGEGRHVISISATDPTGNQAVSKSVDFVIDKTEPTLSFALNGLAYTESRGLVYLTTDAQLTAAVSDMTEDANDFNIQIIKKQPDQAATTPSYLKTANRSFSFSEEADYTINVYSADMANNKSMVRTITFRVDKTAPELSISGTAGGGTSANETAVTFSMREAFWQDATGQVTIYRKAGDGKEETLYKTIDINPSAYLSSVTENLSETGVYRFEFTATDKAGHKVETSQSYTIDRDAPLVSLTGVNNYDITDQSVQFMAQITDDFYTSKKVTLKGTVTGMDGKKKTIDFGSFNQSGNPTVISREFADDGVYDIEVTSTDAAGNSHSSKVHFTIDKTDPEIGEINIIDGSVVNSVDLDFDLDELISDLTVCNAHMYLNGSEYDGVSDIEDGSYTLLITAEDEMGHYVEKTVSFVLDTKAPVFIVTGVEDGDVKNEEYSIDVSLQLAEDTLSSVTLNGKSVEVTDNTASITVNELGDYTLEMSAIDTAGNKASQKISFTYGEEEETTTSSSNWWIWLVIAAALIIIGFTVYATVKKNEKEQQN